jgi:hypothetical protein
VDQTRIEKYVWVSRIVMEHDENKHEVLVVFILHHLLERSFEMFITSKTFPVCQLLQMKQRTLESKRRCRCIIVIVYVGTLFTITILHYSGVYGPSI